MHRQWAQLKRLYPQRPAGPCKQQHPCCQEAGKGHRPQPECTFQCRHIRTGDQQPEKRADRHGSGRQESRRRFLLDTGTVQEKWAHRQRICLFTLLADAVIWQKKAPVQNFPFCTGALRHRAAAMHRFPISLPGSNGTCPQYLPIGCLSGNRRASASARQS